MSNHTNNQPEPLSPNELKEIAQRCITRLLTVLLECLSPVTRNNCRRSRAVSEIALVVKDLQGALRRMGH